MELFIRESYLYKNDLEKNFGPFNVVLGNQSADLDSVAGSLALAYLLTTEESNGRIYIPVINIPKREMKLRQDICFLFDRLFSFDVQSNLTFIDEIDLNALRDNGALNLILVDHHELSPNQQHLGDCVRMIIDHHVRNEQALSRIPSCARSTIETVGSCCTLIAELFVQSNLNIEPSLALLLWSAIACDTAFFSLNFGKTTPKDEKYSKLLERIINRQYVDSNLSYFYASLIEKREDVQNISFEDLLRKDYKHCLLNDNRNIGFSTIRCSLECLLGKADRPIAHFASFCERTNLRILIIISAINVETRYLAVFAPRTIDLNLVCKILTKTEQFYPLNLTPYEPTVENRPPSEHFSSFKQNNITWTRKQIMPLLNELLNRTDDLESNSRNEKMTEEETARAFGSIRRRFMESQDFNRNFSITYDDSSPEGEKAPRIQSDNLTRAQDNYATLLNANSDKMSGIVSAESEQAFYDSLVSDIIESSRETLQKEIDAGSSVGVGKASRDSNQTLNADEKLLNGRSPAPPHIFDPQWDRNYDEISDQSNRASAISQPSSSTPTNQSPLIDFDDEAPPSIDRYVDTPITVTSSANATEAFVPSVLTHDEIYQTPPISESRDLNLIDDGDGSHPASPSRDWSKIEQTSPIDQISVAESFVAPPTVQSAADSLSERIIISAIATLSASDTVSGLDDRVVFEDRRFEATPAATLISSGYPAPGHENGLPVEDASGGRLEVDANDSSKWVEATSGVSSKAGTFFDKLVNKTLTDLELLDEECGKYVEDTVPESDEYSQEVNAFYKQLEQINLDKEDKTPNEVNKISNLSATVTSLTTASDGLTEVKQISPGEDAFLGKDEEMLNGLPPTLSISPVEPAVNSISADYGTTLEDNEAPDFVAELVKPNELPTEAKFSAQKLQHDSHTDQLNHSATLQLSYPPTPPNSFLNTPKANSDEQKGLQAEQVEQVSHELRKLSNSYKHARPSNEIKAGVVENLEPRIFAGKPFDNLAIKMDKVEPVEAEDGNSTARSQPSVQLEWQDDDFQSMLREEGLTPRAPSASTDVSRLVSIENETAKTSRAENRDNEELEWENDTPIKQETAGGQQPPESIDQDRWKTVKISGTEYKVDLVAAEPYRKVIAHGGYYKDGLTAIVVFSACNLPSRSQPDYQKLMENLFFFCVSTLETIIAEEYVIVYFQGGATRDQLPSFSWLRKWYRLIDQRHVQHSEQGIERSMRKNLKLLLLVQSDLWLKAMITFARLFISRKFSRKLRFVDTVQQLSAFVPLEQLDIPEKVLRHEDKKHLDAQLDTGTQ